MKVTKKNVQANDQTTNYTHIELGGKTICFMFSGSGYTYDKPLFYYSTMTMIQNKIDIVHLHYSYGGDLWKQPLDEISKTMMKDISPVISDVLKYGQYNETIFLGKSLGTIPIANFFMKKDEFLKSKMILFTPLLKFNLIFESILKSDHQGLLVIGDKDPHFDLNQMKQLKNSNLKVEVVPNANHSLDIGEFETTNSIVALSNVMEKLQEVVYW
ncbi:alpha/beta hydrolase [Heyndrickxia vini]|uniref:Alpha/beta hydrolase n=1 Tax=Heyndrickxia vini TaxID=1476025 RepID=A0ABX7DXH6_9BACI|nr:alpha/beta hydrolase [Heyndrickxia vini]QQZ07649.1 alpha/beta hydrolase [Heyndrickxia vini]